MTETKDPQDKYNAVWLIFFILGLGTLLPWNFFMTATAYFTSRLKSPGMEILANLTGNDTAEPVSERSVLEAMFNNVMTLCAMVPLLIFTCLNSVLHQRIPQAVRVMGSLACILGLFLITAILVKVEMSPMVFFIITMIKIIFINSFGAMLQGSLFGMAGLLPTSYTTPIMSGQGLAGTFAAFAMICTLSSDTALQDSAFGYFITACAVILIAIVAYMLLPRMRAFSESKPTPEPTQDSSSTVSLFAVFKKIWLMAACVCFAFTITIGLFPAVTVDTKSSATPGSPWERYFIPVSCFLLFNLMDWAGRSLTAICLWPGKDSKLLPALLLPAVVFIPLFMLCNVQPRFHLPIYFSHDGWFIAFMVFFAFSNGYLASLCMCYGPKKVLPHEAETAGAIMAFFLSLGLAQGAGLSFLFRSLI